jgi:hypothetical protein
MFILLVLAFLVGLWWYSDGHLPTIHGLPVGEMLLEGLIVLLVTIFILSFFSVIIQAIVFVVLAFGIYYFWTKQGASK